jgi:hypothetical protein
MKDGDLISAVCILMDVAGGRGSDLNGLLDDEARREQGDRGITASVVRWRDTFIANGGDRAGFARLADGVEADDPAAVLALRALAIETTADLNRSDLRQKRAAGGRKGGRPRKPATEVRDDLICALMDRELRQPRSMTSDRPKGSKIHTAEHVANRLSKRLSGKKLSKHTIRDIYEKHWVDALLAGIPASLDPDDVFDKWVEKQFQEIERKKAEE